MARLQGCLGQHWFASLDEARSIIAAWREDFNTVRPHTALANLTPAAYRANQLEQLRLPEKWCGAIITVASPWLAHSTVAADDCTGIL